MSVLVRCDDCGALRWSLLAKPGASTMGTCDICGSPLKPERRRPGRRFRKGGAERRDLRAPVGRAAPRV
jgi:hypothetical protein